MIASRDKDKIVLLKADSSSLNDFRLALQDSFRVAAEADFGYPLDEPIPSNEDIEQSFNAPGAVTHWILADGQRVGGAIVVIDDNTCRNSLSFFFISTTQQSRGLGLRAWVSIEKEYPQTKVWETVTPYFEKRNIHFYVNKCGFKVVEFYNQHNPDPHEHNQHGQDKSDNNEMFRLEKTMGLHL